MCGRLLRKRMFYGLNGCIVFILKMVTCGSIKLQGMLAGFGKPYVK